MMDILFVGRGYRYAGKALLRRGEFRILKGCFWIYTVLWLVAGVFVYYFWETTVLAKSLATIPLVIGTPSLSDLFETYPQYERKWREGNESVVKQGVSKKPA
jgi:hypothetical protein